MSRVDIEESNANVYVIHALKGYEVHEERIVKLFEEHGLKFQFMTSGDPKYFSKELLDRYFTKEAQERISKGALSCTLNHILAYERMIELDQDYAVVFENDPFFLGDFNQMLASVVTEQKNLPPGFIVSIEISSLRMPSFWDMKKGKHLYKACLNRMAGAYIIDRKACEAIISYLKTKKCTHVIDNWHNVLIRQGVCNVYWAHPPLIEQGSHNGLMSSTISSRSKSWTSQIQWKLKKAYKLYIRRLFPESRVISE